jgi:hypothetical protein
VAKGVYLGNTPVDGAKHHHDLPRRSDFQEGDIWQCLFCEKMYRKEWQDYKYVAGVGPVEEDWIWADYDGPIEKGVT